MREGQGSEVKLSDPNLTPKISETSETCETSEIYSGYLRYDSAIDSV